MVGKSQPARIFTRYGLVGWSWLSSNYKGPILDLALVFAFALALALDQLQTTIEWYAVLIEGVHKAL